MGLLAADLTSPPESADSIDASLWTGVGVDRRKADGVGLEGGSAAVERSEP